MQISKNASLLLTILSFACGGTTGAELQPSDLAGGPFDQSGASLLSREDAEQKAALLVPGTILSSERDTERGLAVFEIDILTQNGAIIEVTLVEETGQVLEIEGKVGPFTDDLDPGTGFITLQVALQKALELRRGEVIEWELELTENRRWKWEFEIRAENDAVWTVELDALSGDVLEHEQARGEDSWDDDMPEDRTRLPESLSARALQIAAGEIVETELELDGFEVWSVKIQMPSGAVIEVEFLAMTGALFEVQSKEGPFVDEVVLGVDYIAFSSARSAADAEADGRALTEWKFERNEHGQAQYRIEYGEDDSRLRVRVDAMNGTVLSAQD